MFCLLSIPYPKTVFIVSQQFSTFVDKFHEDPSENFVRTK